MRSVPINRPPPHSFATCQTRLYLTRQGNDEICHLCKLLHNLIWLVVFWWSRQNVFRFFPDIIGSPVRQHYWLRSRQRHIRVGNGRLNHDDYHLHLSWIVIISVETCFAFRLEDKNGPHVFGADSVYYLNLILLLHHHHLYFNSPVKADTFKAFSAKKRALL